MNRTRLLMIGFVALALGAFVSFVVYKNLQSRTAGPSEPGIDVAVAARDIEVGAKLADADILLVKIPASSVPPNAYHKKSSIIGRGVVLPIAKGDYLLPGKLAAENAGSGLPSLIPPGMRAVSVKVNEVVSVAGFVQPGTHVDVLLTGNPSGSGTQTTTVLENVSVIAAGQKLERNASGEAQNVPVITLLVSPDDAQKLTLAQSQGRIQLALRNPVDIKQQELDPTREGSLYKEKLAPPAPKLKPVKKVINQAAPAVPQPYKVEIYKGKKKEDVTIENQ
jgi:pilus assembly protein CpaB